jgi:Zn-dependent protease
MKQTVPLGRVAGIQVGMHWSVLVMIMMIGWLLGGQVLPAMTPHQPPVAYWVVAVPCAAAFMAALLAHELAHSLVARRYGVPVTSITLWALGGVSELGGEPPTARADLRIRAAGPAASLAAGLVFGGLAAAVRAGGGPGFSSTSLSGSTPGRSARTTSAPSSWYSSTRIRSPASSQRGNPVGRNGIIRSHSSNSRSKRPNTSAASPRGSRLIRPAMVLTSQP